MGALSDYLAGHGDTSSSGGVNPANYRPHSTSLLQSALDQLSQQGSPSQFARGKAIAAGGGGSIAGKLLHGALWAVGAPQRTVLTTGEMWSDIFRGKSGAHDYWKQIKDPSWGGGNIIQEAMPHANPWVKRALGLTLDIASDPLTYMAPGVGAAFREAGGKEGVARLAYTAAEEAANAGDHATASELKGITAKMLRSSSVRGGGASREEMSRLAELIGMHPKDLRYGVALHIPFTQIHGMIPGTETIGRGVLGTGEGISRVIRESPLGSTSGYATLAKRALKSGDPEAAYQASRFLEGIGRSEGAGANFTQAVEKKLNEFEDEFRKAHIDHTAMYDIMDERPIPAHIADANNIPEAERLGGPRFQAFVQDPKNADLAQRFGDFLTEIRPIANETGHYGNSKVDAIVGDSATRLRSFTPRIETPEFMAENAKTFDTGKAGLAAKAAAGTEGEQFLQNFTEGPYGQYLQDGKLHMPGAEMSTGETAGSYADQIENAVRAKVQAEGGEFYPWYERDIIKATRTYIHRVGNQVRNTHQLNFLADHGIATALDATKEAEPWVAEDLTKVASGGTWDQRTAVQAVNPHGVAPHDSIGSLDRLVIHAGGDLPAPTDWNIPGVEAPAAAGVPEAFMPASPDMAAPTGLPAPEQAPLSTAPAAGMARPSGLNQAGAVQDIKSFIKEQRTKLSAQGKVIDKVTYKKYKDLMDVADRAVRAVDGQFAAQGGDGYRAFARAQTFERRANQLIRDGLPESAEAVAELRGKAAAARKAYDMFQMRSVLTDPKDAQVAHLIGSMHNLMAELGTHNGMQALSTAQKAEALTKVLRQAPEGLGLASQLPADVSKYAAELAGSYNVLSQNGATKFITEYYDPVNHWMKSWLTMAPGFSERNMLGGMFNNFLAGVKMRNAWRWMTTYQRSTKGLEALDPVEKLLFTLNQRAGIIGSGQFIGELGTIKEVSFFNPAAGIRGGDKTFVLPYLNRRLNEQVIEPVLRGSLFTDRVVKAIEEGRYAEHGLSRELGLKGVTEENWAQLADVIHQSPQFGSGMADVAKYHFNYNDLSRFERQYVRRVIPFYTWTRHNVPLQIEAFFTQPGKSLGLYYHLKNNLESGVPGEPIVPGYFGEEGFMRTPWTSKGSRVYAGISNLPLFDPFKTADIRGQTLGMVSPLIKAPLEVLHGAQFNTGVPVTGKYTPMPSLWKPLIPLLGAVGKMPFQPFRAPQRAKDGQWYMRDSDQYLLGQYLPFLYQVQRLFPSQPKFQRRLATTWVSFALGLNVRTNTPNEIENEIFRRADQVQNINAELKSLGFKKPPRRNTAGELVTPNTSGLAGPSLESVLRTPYRAGSP